MQATDCLLRQYSGTELADPGRALPPLQDQYFASLLMIELLTGVLFLACYWYFGLTLST